MSKFYRDQLVHHYGSQLDAKDLKELEREELQIAARTRFTAINDAKDEYVAKCNAIRTRYQSLHEDVTTNSP